MSLFDSIINETREKFGLGDKASVLLSILLAKMTDTKSGGIAGFLQRFEAANLSDAVSSWVNSGENADISGEQIEAALGGETMQEIARRTGTDHKTASAATAFMLPRLVHNLTPHGILPEEKDLHSQTGAYLAPDDESFAGVSAGNAFDRIGTSATNVLDEGGANSERQVPVSGAMSDDRANAAVVSASDFETANNNSPLSWLAPLIILALLLILGYAFCGGNKPHKASLNFASYYNQQS